jgi:drug/metabolite transporter (DMT)-like permease
MHPLLLTTAAPVTPTAVGAGVLFLLLSILSSVIIANLLRFSEHRRVSRLVVIAANYITCTVAAVAWGLGPGGLAMNAGAALLGIVTGVSFAMTFWLMIIAIGRVGISIPVSVTRLAVVLPIAVSLLVYHERPNAWQQGGLVLALAALVLFGRSAGGGDGRTVVPRWQTALLVAGLFVGMGINGVNMKVFEEDFSADASLYAFLAFLFGTAMVLSWTLVLVRRRERVTRLAVGLGLLLGVPNLLSSVFFILALRYLPGMVVFPLNDVGIVIVSALTGVLFWREKLSPVTRLALAISLVAIALMNL